MSIGATDDEILILRAQAGDSAAYDGLCAAHDRATFGFIRARCRTDDDAREVLQEARIAIWQHLGRYQPERASFRAFVTFWAGICVMRFYRSRKRLHEVESLFSELIERFPELEQEQEVADVLAWIGGNRGPEDDPEPVPTETYERLLRSVLDPRNPPHQIIAFCFCQLVRVSPAGEADEGSAPGGRGRTAPRVIAKEFSDVPLGSLLLRLEEDYMRQSTLSDVLVRDCFKPLQDRMMATVGQTIGDPKGRETYRHLLDRITGDTTLRDYFTAGPEADIPHWWYAVRRRVLSEAKTRGPGESGAEAPASSRLAARNPVPWRSSGGREP
jgi:DNA-directed RNA polymerase specialized sigma24 family protein